MALGAIQARYAALYERFVNAILYRMNAYLASRDGFFHSVGLSFLWVAGAYSLDLFPSTRSAAAGLVFAYLAFATAFSFITQFNITHVAEAGAKLAERSRLRAEAADEQTVLILQRMVEADTTTRNVLEALAQTLGNQGHMIEALVEISRQETALTIQVEDAVERIEEIQRETVGRHLENQKLIRKLFQATRPIAQEALAEGKKARKRAPRGK